MHIASWALTIILYVIAFYIFQNHSPTPMFKPLQMALRVFMLLTLFSGFWLLIQEFMAASHGGEGNHMLLTLKMLCGIAVVALMEVSVAKRKKHKSWFILGNNYFNNYYYVVRYHPTMGSISSLLELVKI